MEQRDLPCCEESQVHLDAVERVRGLLPADETLYDLAELFKIFGDSTRDENFVCPAGGRAVRV